MNGIAAECIALDVHKRTITASYSGGDSKTWKFPTTRKKIVNGLKQYGNIPVVLEASTSEEAVAPPRIRDKEAAHDGTEQACDDCERVSEDRQEGC